MIKTIAIIILSVTFFGVLFFILVRNALKRKIDILVEEEKKRKFSDCCNSDILSLLKGKIYRCPFSANAENLNAIPLNKEDHIDLNDPKISKQELKNKIKDLVYNKEYITACSYCNGRDYTVGKIKAGEQTKKPLEYSRV